MLNLQSCAVAKNLLLTPAIIKKRCTFAKKYQNWTKDEWSKVMFSDGSSFKCFMARLGRLKRLQGSNRHNAQFTIKCVKHRHDVMVWDSFTVTDGRSNIYFLSKNCTTNLDRYLKVLEDHLLRHFETHGCNMFQHDSASCHTARKWLSVLGWPDNSPITK